MWVGNRDGTLPLEISLYERGRINHVCIEGGRGEGGREGEIYLVIFAVLLVIVSEVTLVMVDSLSSL